MVKSLYLRRAIILSTIYGSAAVLSVGMTRMNGGFAMLWIATAVLVAGLMGQSPRRWYAPLGACAGVIILVTGMLGLGWKAPRSWRSPPA
ncbi:MAG: hypothetical protein Q8R44_17990 [Novosphingobium sp.]|nr:hypothetical protein [Novosphingobium sp.]